MVSFVTCSATTSLVLLDPGLILPLNLNSQLATYMRLNCGRNTRLMTYLLITINSYIQD